MSITDFHLPAAEPIQTLMTTEFEGGLITGLEGRIPAVKVECPESYKRGTILKLSMEVRVKSVRLEENRDGDLTRSHVFAIESVNVDEVYDPAAMIAELSGSVDTYTDPSDIVAPMPVDTEAKDMTGSWPVVQPTVETRLEDLERSYEAGF